MSDFKNELLQGYTERIRKYEIDNLKNYVYIGMNLAEIQAYNMLENTEYKNIKQYALDNFGYESSKTYNLINVYNKFFIDDKLGTINGKYLEYNFSQLVYMLSMSDDELKQCNPNMTVRQIKEIRLKKSTCAENETIENIEKLKNDNVIEGVFPEKIVQENREKTLIISEMPQEKVQENTTIITEKIISTEQNKDFVTLDDKQMKINKLSEEITDLKIKILNKDSEIYNLKTEIGNIQINLKDHSEMIQYIYNNLQKLNIKATEKLINEIYYFYAEGKLPEKLNFFKNVI